MDTVDFSAIARRYERDSTVQRGAAETLLDLLAIGPREDVLDLCCGTGHLTARIRELTSGRVEAIDPAPGMIETARAQHGHVHFAVAAAEDFDRETEFDVLICNSTMQWFRDPPRALARCRRALRPDGRIGVQAPATEAYCPQFVAAMAEVARHPATRDTFARFRSPGSSSSRGTPIPKRSSGPVSACASRGSTRSAPSTIPRERCAFSKAAR